MRALLDALPQDSRLACPPGDFTPWTTRDELTAQLIEEVAVLAADQRRKKPRTVTRPVWLARLQSGRDPVTGTAPVTDPSTVSTETSGEIRGHLAVAAKFAAVGRVRVSGE
jgi:hypothetical protein